MFFRERKCLSGRYTYNRYTQTIVKHLLALAAFIAFSPSWFVSFSIVSITRQPILFHSSDYLCPVVQCSSVSGLSRTHVIWQV